MLLNAFLFSFTIGAHRILGRSIGAPKNRPPSTFPSTRRESARPSLRFSRRERLPPSGPDSPATLFRSPESVRGVAFYASIVCLQSAANVSPPLDGRNARDARNKSYGYVKTATNAKVFPARPTASSRRERTLGSSNVRRLARDGVRGRARRSPRALERRSSSAKSPFFVRFETRFDPTLRLRKRRENVENAVGVRARPLESPDEKRALRSKDVRGAGSSRRRASRRLL